MTKLSEATFEAFVQSHHLAAILFGANWASQLVDTVRSSFKVAEDQFGDQVGFAEIDVDEYPDIARSLPIGNVPTVAYFKEGNLVAALIGANQDVRARISAVIEGSKIGYSDGRVVMESASLPLSTRFLRVLRASVVNPFIKR